MGCCSHHQAAFSPETQNPPTIDDIYKNKEAFPPVCAFFLWPEIR